MKHPSVDVFCDNSSQQEYYQDAHFVYFGLPNDFGRVMRDSSQCF